MNCTWMDYYNITMLLNNNFTCCLIYAVIKECIPENDIDSQTPLNPLKINLICELYIISTDAIYSDPALHSTSLYHHIDGDLWKQNYNVLHDHLNKTLLMSTILLDR